MSPHRLSLRVYYEDTDAIGVVYYANYLKWLERGRTEALRAIGAAPARLGLETGAAFVVARLEIDYLRPARLDDVVEVETAPCAVAAASLWMAQSVWRDDATLARARVRLACVGSDGRARRLPDAVRRALTPEAD